MEDSYEHKCFMEHPIGTLREGKTQSEPKSMHFRTGILSKSVNNKIYATTPLTN